MAESVKVLSDHGDEYDVLVGDGGIDPEAFELWVKAGHVRLANSDVKEPADEAKAPVKRGRPKAASA